MLALGATLKTLIAVVDAPLQRLVVAGLEMQTVNPLDGAPVASIGNLGWWETGRQCVLLLVPRPLCGLLLDLRKTPCRPRP